MKVTLNRQLIGLEDITFGVGTEEQTRGGQTVEITKINAANLPFDEVNTLQEVLYNSYPLITSVGEKLVGIDRVYNSINNIDAVVAELVATNNIDTVGADLLLGVNSEIRKANLLRENIDTVVSIEPKLDSIITLEPKLVYTIALESKLDYSKNTIEPKIDFVISKETLLNDFNLITPEKFENAVTLLDNLSFQNVASTLDEIVALIPHLQKIIDLHLNLGTLIEVDGLSDELEAIVPYLTNIVNVSNATIDWSTLGANLNKLVNISNNLTALLGIEPYMPYISDVYDIKSQVTTVANMENTIEYIANSGANLEYLSDNIDYVMEVQDNIVHIIAIKDYIQNIVTVSNNINSINTVANNMSAVAAVGNRILSNGSLCPTIVDTEVSDGTTYSSEKIESELATKSDKVFTNTDTTGAGILVGNNVVEWTKGFTAFTGAILVELTGLYNEASMVGRMKIVINQAVGDDRVFYIDGRWLSTTHIWDEANVVEVSTALTKLNVRFARDIANSKVYLVIGETSSTWNALRIMVDEVLTNYNLSLNLGFVITSTTDISGLTVDYTKTDIQASNIDDYLGNLVTEELI